MANGLKKLLAVAAATDISFPAAEQMKAYLADPSAFAVAAPVAAAAEEKVEAAAEEEEESEDESMGFDLLDKKLVCVHDAEIVLFAKKIFFKKTRPFLKEKRSQIFFCNGSKMQRII